MMLASCSTPGGNRPTPAESLSPMPPTPQLIQFTRQPIIEKIGDDYKVSDEFVTQSAQRKRYMDKVLEWKEKNAVR